MSDFLERFGADLVLAEQRLMRQAERKHVRRHRPRRRTTLLLLALLTLAVPAAIATQPWQPILGDPAHENTPAGVSRTPPPKPQLDKLGILRRPPNEADHGPIAQKLLANVGAEYKGVRLASIRLLTSATGYHALLVPSEAHGKSSEPGRYEVADDLCVEQEAGSFCGPIDGLAKGAFVGASFSVTTGQSPIVGLVPDGVASVELRLDDGRVLRAKVNENFFSVDSWARRENAGRLPPLKMRWLDAAGRVIGPEGHQRG